MTLEWGSQVTHSPQKQPHPVSIPGELQSQLEGPGSRSDQETWASKSHFSESPLAKTSSSNRQLAVYLQFTKQLSLSTLRITEIHTG